MFTGRLDDDALADQYAKCLAVFYAPIDEDMGYVPFEAFLAEKPVVTTRDAGGPLEVVEDGERASSASRLPARSPKRSPGSAPIPTRLAPRARPARAWPRS